MQTEFEGLFGVEDPGVSELVHFVDAVHSFLSRLLEDDVLMNRLTGGDDELVALARSSFAVDVVPGLHRLKAALEGLEALSLEGQDARPVETDSLLEGLNDHGLLGVSAAFKYAVLAKASRGWRRYRGQLTPGPRFVMVLDAVDVIPDSLIGVFGAGGAVKEFKDALRTLTPMRVGA